MNRSIFPDRGGYQRFNGEITMPGSDLTYYKLTYSQQRYFPVFDDYVLLLKGKVGYGDGYSDTEELPFFENFYAGGIRSVRGFEDNTLGPKDEFGEAIGGAVLNVFNAEILFPVPFVEAASATRLSTFLDIGNVYSDIDDFDASDLRFTVGLAGVWASPLGPISVSFGYPLNAEDDDEEQNFQFTVGTFF